MRITSNIDKLQQGGGIPPLLATLMFQDLNQLLRIAHQMLNKQLEENQKEGLVY